MLAGELGFPAKLIQPSKPTKNRGFHHPASWNAGLVDRAWGLNVNPVTRSDMETAPWLIFSGSFLHFSGGSPE
jgi:hypothetical protein